MTFTLEEPIRVTRPLQYVGYAGLVLLVALGVWAWRATRPDLDPDTAARTVAGVAVLVYTEDYEGPITAMARLGRLTVLDGGCLGLEDGALLVFSKGTQALEVDGVVAVRTPDGDVLRPGDDVAFGGHLLDDTPIADFGGDLGDQVPKACRDHPAVAADGGIDRGVSRPPDPAARSGR